MKVIILNYPLICVDVVHVPDNEEEIENNLVKLGYDLDSIHWMISEDEGTPVFYDNEECPITVL